MCSQIHTLFDPVYPKIYNIQNPVREDLRNFFPLFHTPRSQYFIQMWDSPSDIPFTTHFENSRCVRDIFIRYKLKLKQRAKKKRKKKFRKNRKRVKKRGIYRRRNISTIALSSVKFAVSAAVKIIDNDNWIGSQAKAFTNSRARTRVCSVDIPVKLEFLSLELQYPVMHIVLNRTQ